MLGLVTGSSVDWESISILFHSFCEFTHYSYCTPWVQEVARVQQVCPPFLQAVQSLLQYRKLALFIVLIQ